MNRNELPAFLNSLNLEGTGVEIWVGKGEFSEIILEKSNLTKLVSIDSWTNEPDSTYKDINNHTQRRHDDNYAVTRHRLSKFWNRSVISRKRSQDAAADFAEDSLDFVYIDANHSYEACKNDLETWWGKLSEGGVFAGHDYIPDGTYDQGIFWVKSAVDEFCSEKGILLQITDEKDWKSWYFVKGQTRSRRNLVLTIAIGAYSKLAKVTHPSIKAYAKKIGAEFMAITEKKIAQTTPHWEKFQIGELLNIYDRIIYVDTDVIIREDTPNLFDIVPSNELGVFNEAPFTHRSKEMMIDMCREYETTIEDWDGIYFNSGVMVVSQCHKLQGLFTKPEKEIFNFYEQTYLNMVVARDKITVCSLPYHYNRMTCMDTILGEERHAAFIIHYAGCPSTETVAAIAAEDIEKWSTGDYNYKRHILVLVGGGLGDQVCAEPVIRFMKKYVYPNDDVRITTNWERLFQHLDVPIYHNGGFTAPIDTQYRIFKSLPEPDTADGAPMWNVVSHLLCHPVDFMSMAVLRRTLPIADRQYRLEVNPEDKARMEEAHGSMKNFVLVHAGSHWETKTFPLHYWQLVVDGLAEKGHTVVLIGKTGGEGLEYRWFVPVKCPKNGIDLRDKTTLGELITLISEAKTLISNDSSPVHIAGAFDNEIVLIPTCKHPDHILPWRNGNQYYKAKTLYKKLTIDDMSTQPTEIYPILGDKFESDWRDYLPEPEDVINAI